jgi:dienelactone hydrolase
LCPDDELFHHTAHECDGGPDRWHAKTTDIPLIQLAELDTDVNEGWPAYEAALKAAGKVYTMHMYANANHGFHNDTTPRDDKVAAGLAWQRTIEFFGEKLV